MKYKICSMDTLTTLERQALDDLSHAAFPADKVSDEIASIEWSRSEWGVFVRDDDDQLVSFIGLVTRQATCDGRTVFMGGVGGVATFPHARQKGYAGFGMQKASDYLRDELKVDFSLLVCSDTLLPYYGKFGWQRFEGDVLIHQSAGKVPFTFANRMLSAGAKPIPTCAVIDLCGKPW